MHTTIDSTRVLLEKSVEFYKKHWKEVARLMLGFLLVCLVLMSISFPLSFLPFIGPIINQLLSLGFGVIIVFSIPKFLQDLDHGKTPSVVDALEATFSNFKEFLLVFILATALIYGGSVAFVVPGIFFVFGVILYPYIATLEEKKGLGVLISSYWRTDGLKRKIFARSALINLSVSVVALFVWLLAGLIVLGIAVVVPFMALKIVLAAPIVIAALLFTLFVFMPFSFIPQYMIYKSIKTHVHGEPDHAYHERKKKMFKIFIGIGLVVWLFVILGAGIPDNDRHDRSGSMRFNSYKIR